MEENFFLKNLTIYHFLETQLQLFKNQFLITRASTDKEAIHKMRLAIKRIRTIQKLKKHIHFPTIIDRDQIKSIKTIFTVSGNLRDLQIQQTLLEGYSKRLRFSFLHLFNHLAGYDHTLTEKFNSTIRETDFSIFLDIPEHDQSMDDLNGKTDLEQESLDFLQKKIENIQKIIYTLDHDEFVHDLRKEIKHLFFILQFLKNHFPDSVFSNFHLKPLKSAGEKIGNWNDRAAFKEMLREFISEKPEDFLLENAEYKILMYVLDDEKRRLLSGIETDLYLELMKLKVLVEKSKKDNAFATDGISEHGKI